MKGAPIKSRAALLGLALALSLPAQAYERAGHFYSIQDVLAHAMADRPEQARVIAFCVQLPDESRELDAAEQYSRSVKKAKLKFLGWAVGDDPLVDPAVREMVLVQRLLHVLVGGRHVAAARAATLANVRQLARQARATLGGAEENTALCATGLALHAYGDSFAHVRMDQPDHLYPTGRGHAVHVHYPDYPLCERFKAFGLTRHCETAADEKLPRAQGWKEYFASVDQALREAFGSPATTAAATGAFLAELREADCARDRHDWCELKLQDQAVADIADAPQRQATRTLGTALSQHKMSSCHQTLGVGWTNVPTSLLPGIAPACDRVFALYRTSAQAAIEAAAPEIKLDPLPSPAFD